MAASPKNFGEDNQKIAFVLSYLRKGDADSWAESFQTQKSIGKKPEDALDLGTWTQFATDLEDAFQVGIRRTRCYLRSQQISHDKEHHRRRPCSTLQDLGRQIRTQGGNDLIAKFQRSITPTIEKNCSPTKKNRPPSWDGTKQLSAADNTDRENQRRHRQIQARKPETNTSD